MEEGLPLDPGEGQGAATMGSQETSQSHSHKHAGPIDRLAAAVAVAETAGEERPGIECIARIGPYELGSKLGEGSFAMVRLGTHLPTGGQVAVKLFDKTKITEDYLRRHMYREGELLQRVDHPNIIRLLDVIEKKEVLCLVQEKAEIDLLEYILTLGTHTEAEAKKFFRQLISAVHCLHHHDIVHRDLKVENLMLDADKNLKIIDFGLSGDLTGRDHLSTHCGSMAYSAPELLCRKPYGKPVDVWSMGVCLYVMLTGHLPFASEGLTQQHALMLDGQFTLPDEFSAPVKDLFDNMFQVRPKKRISLEALAAHPWVQGVPEPGPVLRDVSNVAITTLEMDLIEQMVNMGMSDEDTISRAVLTHQCNHVSACYHLLKATRQRQKRRRLERRRSSTESVNSGSGPTFAAKVGAAARRKSTQDTPPRRQSSRRGRRSSQTDSDLDSGGSDAGSRRGSLHRRSSDASMARRLSGSGPEAPAIPQRRGSLSTSWKPGLNSRRASSSDIAPLLQRRGSSKAPHTMRRNTSVPSLRLAPPSSSPSSAPVPSPPVDPFAAAIEGMVEACQGSADSRITRARLATVTRVALLHAPSPALFKALRPFGWSGTDFKGNTLNLPQLRLELEANFGASPPSSPGSRGSSPRRLSLSRTSSRGLLRCLSDEDANTRAAPAAEEEPGALLPSPRASPGLVLPALSSPGVHSRPAFTFGVDDDDDDEELVQVTRLSASARRQNRQSLSRPASSSRRSSRPSSGHLAKPQEGLKTSRSHGSLGPLRRAPSRPGSSRAKSPRRARGVED